MPTQGKVYLIGAGPGDPGLVTVRARELIELADVIVYDYLANSKILDWAKPDCERIYVGKSAGRHSIPIYLLSFFSYNGYIQLEFSLLEEANVFLIMFFSCDVEVPTLIFENEGKGELWQGGH